MRQAPWLFAGSDDDWITVERPTVVIDKGEERGIVIMTRLTLMEREHVMWGTNFSLGPMHNVVESRVHGKSEWKKLSIVCVNLSNSVVWYELLPNVGVKVLSVRHAVIRV